MCFIRKFWPDKKYRLPATMGFCAASVLLSFLASANAADPGIDYISTTNIGTHKEVEIHFGTPAESTSRKYVLQYINALPGSNGVTFTNWSNLYTGFSFPFTNHYIIPDARTNASRFYRLRVTP